MPGETPIHTDEPVQMFWEERRRVEMAAKALKELDAGVILVSGGNVHPDHTPYNEAYEMKTLLVKEYGVPADRVIIDPYARHSTTNLRNAGRFILAYNVGGPSLNTPP